MYPVEQLHRCIILIMFMYLLLFHFLGILQYFIWRHWPEAISSWVCFCRRSIYKPDDFAGLCKCKCIFNK